MLFTQQLSQYKSLKLENTRSYTFREFFVYKKLWKIFVNVCFKILCLIVTFLFDEARFPFNRDMENFKLLAT